MPFLDEICGVCEKELGELPACTPCVTAETPEQFLRKAEQEQILHVLNLEQINNNAF